MPQYFVHNGYWGWSYGVPCDPQLISDGDAERLMSLAGLTMPQVAEVVPPAQYASENDALFFQTGGNRFLCYGNINACVDVRSDKCREPLLIPW